MNVLRSVKADAERVFRAALQAVSPERLIASIVSIDDQAIQVAGNTFFNNSIDRLLIVGAGKASGEMARSLVARINQTAWREKSINGWVNVPEGAEFDLPGVKIFPARPIGENLPTVACVLGTKSIIHLMSQQTPRGLCLVLVSGGGSALLCLPKPTIKLIDKRMMTQFISARGGDIVQLNTLRSRLSQVKQGGLLDFVGGGAVVGLILSDVLGNPLELIASGPTVRVPTGAQDVELILRQLKISRPDISGVLWEALTSKAIIQPRSTQNLWIGNQLIGSLETAVTAATEAAQELGYRCQTMIQSPHQVDDADELGEAIADRLARQLGYPDPKCWIYAGEPTVRLVDQPGLGGRNQQLGLAFIAKVLGSLSPSTLAHNFCLLSCGTDGEDGRTPIAGVAIDNEDICELARRGVDPSPYLIANDAFSIFRQTGMAVHTDGPRTNVGDLRILITHPLKQP